MAEKTGSSNWTQEEVWQRIDHHLLNLKLQQFSTETRSQTTSDKAEIFAEMRRRGNDAYYAPARVSRAIARANEAAEKQTAICLDVWKTQGYSPCPSLYRAIHARLLSVTFAARKSSFVHDLSSEDARTGNPGRSTYALQDFVRRMDRLSADWSTKLEIMAKECAYSTARSGSNPSASVSSERNESEIRKRIGETWWRLPEPSSPDPVPQNPFPRNHPKHEVWTKASRAAEQAVFLFNASFNDAMQEFEYPQTYTEALRFQAEKLSTIIIKKFDIWAERGVHVVWSDQDAEAFDKWLVQYANAWLEDQTTSFQPDEGNPSWLIEMLRSRLFARVEYWKSEARRYLAEQEKLDQATRAGTKGTFEELPNISEENVKQKLREKLIQKIHQGKPGEYITRKQAAVALDVTERTVRRLVEDGILKNGPKRSLLTTISLAAHLSNPDKAKKKRAKNRKPKKSGHSRT